MFFNKNQNTNNSQLMRCSDWNQSVYNLRVYLSLNVPNYEIAHALVVLVNKHNSMTASIGVIILKANLNGAIPLNVSIFLKNMSSYRNKYISLLEQANLVYMYSYH